MKNEADIVPQNILSLSKGQAGVDEGRECIEARRMGLLKDLRLCVSLIFVILSQMSRLLQLGFVHSRSDQTPPTRSVASGMFRCSQLKILDDLNVQWTAGSYTHAMR